MALKPGDVTNFKTLQLADKGGDLAMIECKDQMTGEYVAVIVAMGWDAEANEYVLTPLARMFTGNPYDEVTPPGPADTIYNPLDPTYAEAVAARKADGRHPIG